jgi:hypothetical protein
MDKEIVRNLLRAAFIVIMSGWTLYDRERESRRLLKADLLWRPLKPGEDEGPRLKTIKRRMVIGYWIFLSIALVLCAFWLFELGKSLGWF